MRDLPAARVNLNAGLGPADGFNSVDFRIVLRPWFRKSMSSLSSRISLTCPTPNFECSIQFVGFHFIKVLLSRVAFKGSTNSTIDEGSDQRSEVRKNYPAVSDGYCLFVLRSYAARKLQFCPELHTLRTENSAPSPSEKEANAVDDGAFRSCVWLAFSPWLPLLFIRGSHGFAHLDPTFPPSCTSSVNHQPIYLPATRLNDIGATRGSITRLEPSVYCLHRARIPPSNCHPHKTPSVS